MRGWTPCCIPLEENRHPPPRPPHPPPPPPRPALQQFLLDANISRPALEGVASKLHSEMGLQQEESRAEIQGILARQLRVFRDAGGGTTAGGGGLVQLQIMQKLNSKLVFLDVLDVDLNAPLTDVAAYFVAVCRDFGFPHVVYVALVEKARAGIAAARAVSACCALCWANGGVAKRRTAAQSLSSPPAAESRGRHADAPACARPGGGRAALPVPRPYAQVKIRRVNRAEGAGVQDRRRGPSAGQGGGDGGGRRRSASRGRAACGAACGREPPKAVRHRHARLLTLWGVVNFLDSRALPVAASLARALAFGGTQVAEPEEEPLPPSEPPFVC